MQNLFLFVFSLFIGSSVTGSEFLRLGETPIGFFEYKGGFIQGLELQFNPSKPLKGFRIAVPNVCGEHSNVKVVTSGITLGLELVTGSKDTYAMPNGSSLNVTAIRIDMNGTTSTACQIPVYNSTTVPQLAVGWYSSPNSPYPKPAPVYLTSSATGVIRFRSKYGSGADCYQNSPGSADHSCTWVQSGTRSTLKVTSYTSYISCRPEGCYSFRKSR